MSDEDLLDSKMDRPDDMAGMFVHISEFIPWKVTAFVFIAFIILNTSTFIDRILGHWPGMVEGRCPTERGLVVQGLLLALGVVIMSILVGGELI